MTQLYLIAAFSSKRFLQSVVFSPLLLTTALLTFPLDVYGESIQKEYGISVQGWLSWSWDWIKAEMIAIVLGTMFIWLLYVVIRHSPRRWWLYFWLVALPIGLFVIFIGPWVIDPLFHAFAPLQRKDPALTASLERMVEHAGEKIPPERMFWMGAGEKTTALNAYVTGFGASKRVVVWDTTMAKMSTEQIVYVAGQGSLNRGGWIWRLIHLISSTAWIATSVTSGCRNGRRSSPTYT